jgi:hypothetical protein
VAAAELELAAAPPPFPPEAAEELEAAAAERSEGTKEAFALAEPMMATASIMAQNIFITDMVFRV